MSRAFKRLKRIFPLDSHNNKIAKTRFNFHYFLTSARGRLDSSNSLDKKRGYDSEVIFPLRESK